ncbi:MAG: hypothetical protein H8E68_08445 [Kiritimatiellaeota bacterium]|nr:hypothetical protein [Kiritimatiellota bacterium]
MKKLLIALIVGLISMNSQAVTMGYHNIVIKKVIQHFGYTVLQADSEAGNTETFTDKYFIVPKADNTLVVNNRILATLLSAQASGARLKIWVHSNILDAGAGVTGNSLFSVQVISE